jgi:spermidine/putrescine transport system substrate-binding protein
MTRAARPAAVLALIAATLLAPGCGKKEAAAPAGTAGTPAPAGPTRDLHVYTWADYVKPELLARFEKEHNARVVIDTFDSNEAMYAKLKAGASGYDLITPSSYMVAIMNGQGLLQPFDHAKVPNIRNIDPEYLKLALDPEMKVSVPYMLTNTGFAYLKSKMPNVDPSWAVFTRSEAKGRATMLNDMRETIGAALKSLGHSLNTTDETQLAAARDVVLKWKRNLAKFENEQYKTGLASGEFLLVHAYNGDVLQVMPENPDIAFAVPKEGTSMACDDFVIPKDAKNVDLAHAYVNFMHDPAAAAENTQQVQFLCPNAPSYPMLPAEYRSNPAIFMDPAIRARSEVIRDLGADNAKYTKIWDEIKAAK